MSSGVHRRRIGADQLALWLALTSHVLYLQHLFSTPTYDLTTQARIVSTLVTAALLILAQRPAGAVTSTPASPSRAATATYVAITVASGVALLTSPFIWMVTIPLLGSLWMRQCTGSLPNRRSWIPIGLLVLAFPHENYLSPLVDETLQIMTAHCAVPLVRLTGLDVMITGLPATTLATSDLHVEVTGLCAGNQTFLILLTLGGVLAGFFLESTRARVFFVAITPLAGFVGNVMRVVASTHAANRWIDDPWLWDTAHGLIGYGTFLGIYLLLFVTVHLLQRSKVPALDSPATN